MIFDPITSGALAFLAVLILMALNIPIGISMPVSYTHLTLPTNREV